jgi:hypothetical protein
MTDDDYVAFYASINNDLVKKLQEGRRESSVTTAIELLLGRLVCAGQSIEVLRKHAAHEYAFDGAMILRGMYDTMLQALYILSDSAQQESRAKQYIDYYWAEKQKMIGVFDQSPTYAGQRVSISPRRKNIEPKIQREFQRVRPTFETSKGKLRNRWHEGNLAKLAEDVGYLSEYNILQRKLSAAVHSSSFALREPNFFYENVPMMLFAWIFIFRVLGKFAIYKGITLEKHESDLIALSVKNIFDDYINQIVDTKGKGI